MPTLAKTIFPVSATVIVGLVILGIRWLHSISEFPQDAIGGSCGAIGCLAHGDIFFLMIGGLGIAIAYLLSKQLGQALATMPMAGQVVFLGTILAIISVLIFGLLRTIDLTDGEPVPVGFYSLAALAFGFASVLIAYFFSNKQDWSSSKYVLAFLLGILPSVLFIAPCIAG
tara:strand:- start:146 stop:658 length:513 start_codon:yes stop_codon:yes gene_type:complete